MAVLLDELMHIPAFRGLPTRILWDVASLCKHASFPAGHALIHEGDPADYMYIIVSGSVSIELHKPGHGGTVLETLGVGDILGWSWIIRPHRYRFDAKTRAETHVMIVEAAPLRKKCDEDYEFGYLLMKRLLGTFVRRLEGARMRLLDVAVKTEGSSTPG